MKQRKKVFQKEKDRTGKDMKHRDGSFVIFYCVVGGVLQRGRGSSEDLL